jgi:putative FmdB family regulatory protein
MPTYEYRCPNGHDFERFYRKISDASSAVSCPECGKIAERIMSLGGGLLFKGSGFYLTDYGKNAHRGDAPTKSEKGEGGAKESGGSSDAGGSTEKAAAPASASGGESKPASETKPAPAKPATEAKPASPGSSPKKDK